uniref:Uncharacterized protein n=1 Tax=Oncorhynchus mykiss TaxID=8022 RepID=A0A8C7VE97_ONCMY
MVGGERSNVLLPCSEDHVNTLTISIFSCMTSGVVSSDFNTLLASQSHKFREPPIPSVLPKPPSHWVSHPVLKSLLKVQS